MVEHDGYKLDHHKHYLWSAEVWMQPYKGDGFWHRLCGPTDESTARRIYEMTRGELTKTARIRLLNGDVVVEEQTPRPCKWRFVATWKDGTSQEIDGVRTWKDAAMRAFANSGKKPAMIDRYDTKAGAFIHKRWMLR